MHTVTVDCYDYVRAKYGLRAMAVFEKFTVRQNCLRVRDDRLLDQMIYFDGGESGQDVG